MTETQYRVVYYPDGEYHLQPYTNQVFRSMHDAVKLALSCPTVAIVQYRNLPQWSVLLSSDDIDMEV